MMWQTGLAVAKPFHPNMSYATRTQPRTYGRTDVLQAGKLGLLVIRPEAELARQSVRIIDKELARVRKDIKKRTTEVSGYGCVWR